MKEIPLTRGMVALVDDHWFGYLSQWKWYADKKGYAIRAAPGGKGKIFMHRVVCKTPDNLQTDHINRNKSDNQEHNLRAVTHGENIVNRKLKSNTSGFTNVYHHKPVGKWQGLVQRNRQWFSLGLHWTPQEAHEAVQRFLTSYEKGEVVK